MNSLWERTLILNPAREPWIPMMTLIALAIVPLVLTHALTIGVRSHQWSFQSRDRIRRIANGGILVLLIFAVLVRQTELRVWDSLSFSPARSEQILFTIGGLILGIFLGVASGQYLTGLGVPKGAPYPPLPRYWIFWIMIAIVFIAVIADMLPVLTFRGLYLWHGTTFGPFEKALIKIDALRMVIFWGAMGFLMAAFLVRLNQRGKLHWIFACGGCPRCAYPIGIPQKTCTECGFQ